MNSIYVENTEKAYDIAAEFYDNREWMIFWEKNEMPLILSKLDQKYKKILEVGCGTGFYTLKLLDICHSFCGVDPSKNMIEQLYKKIPHKHNKKIEIKKEDITKNSLPLNFFDLVISVRVLSNIKNYQKALAEMVRVTKPGGTILISDLHPKYKIDYCVLKNPVNKHKIKTPFYKHNIDKIVRNLEKNCELLELNKISMNEVNWVPPKGKSFDEALIEPSIPIFYIMKLKKKKKLVNMLPFYK
jgi:ubiquinone/menaquinone biosynthesis C-methylase UbiE